MRTNGFALYRGEDAGGRALEAAARVKRYAREVLLGVDGDLYASNEARVAGEREVVLAYRLEGRGFPLVHGFEPAAYEFSLVGKAGGRDVLERDPLGTRGLWTQGEGAELSVASDYRLLGPGASLEPPGHAPRGHASGLGFAESAGELAALLEESVARRVKGEAKVAVSFSGGLDSSIIALLASRTTDVVLCSAYAHGSRDESQTERAASLLGLELKTATLDGSSVKEAGRAAELPPGEPTTMDIALWCIYSSTSALASESGARMILLGQAADEMFGGYMKYASKGKEDVPAAERMMREDIRACADRGFLRDEAACSARCEVRFPFADPALAVFAESTPFEFKVRDGVRKAVLREAARQLGLPDELVEAPKKAAQFSSGVAKLAKTD